MQIDLSHLTLADIKLALRDLLTKREPELLRCRAGMFYVLELQEIRAAVDALPEELTTAAPSAAKLHVIDVEHDGFGAALYHFAEAYIRLPTTTPELRLAAERIRDAFVPELAELGADYGTQVRRAESRRMKLEELKNELRSFPALPRGETLYDVASRFLATGRALGETAKQGHDFSANAAASTPGGPPMPTADEADALRAKAVSVLNRLRGDIAKELARDPKLPADLELRLLGYFDFLDGQRRESEAALLRQT